MPAGPTLECVVNVSEGTDTAVIKALAAACRGSLLDVHRDRHHNRSVFTLAGPEVEVDVRQLSREAAARIDLSSHVGVHPRFGSIDVVPFVPISETGATMAEAIAARNAYATWASDELGIPVFLYGPERTLPDVRKSAFRGLLPDAGPPHAHERNGAIAAGARTYLIAYNLWLRDTPLSVARRIARAMRSWSLRTLALQVGGQVQISCNLIEPLAESGATPASAYDLVAASASIARAELVGLLPASVLHSIPSARWGELDLEENKMIEARLALRNGLQPGEVDWT